MERPLLEEITDLRNKLIDALNNSTLHPAISTLVVKDVYEQVIEQAEQINKNEIAMITEAMMAQEQENVEAEEPVNDEENLDVSEECSESVDVVTEDESDLLSEDSCS